MSGRALKCNRAPGDCCSGRGGLLDGDGFMQASGTCVNFGRFLYDGVSDACDTFISLRRELGVSVSESF